jgi:hypothetical protein
MMRLRRASMIAGLCLLAWSAGLRRVRVGAVGRICSSLKMVFDAVVPCTPVPMDGGESS